MLETSSYNFSIETLRKDWVLVQETLRRLRNIHSLRGSIGMRSYRESFRYQSQKSGKLNKTLCLSRVSYWRKRRMRFKLRKIYYNRYKTTYRKSTMQEVRKAVTRKDRGLQSQLTHRRSMDGHLSSNDD